MENSFATGFLIASNLITQTIFQSASFAVFCQNCLDKHKEGNWGDLEPEDMESNNDALISNSRILSSYSIPEDLKNSLEKKIWIITEWNRETTTILFPSEY